VLRISDFRFRPDLMPTHVALLRGINVGGRGMVSMADVRDLFESLGFAGARTLLQSGNVVFDAGRGKSPAALERLLEAETAKRCGVAAAYFVRTAAEWDKVVARNPFPAEAKDDPGRLVVTLLKEAPRADDVEALRTANRGREVIRADARHLYVTYPDGMGRSKLTNAVIERVLGTRATARNWNTVLKLAAACA
jgi:uncharacterized protein (DUF1697 family)